jgi:hypothetical protein
MGRWMTAAYLNQSNQVLARIEASRKSAGSVLPAIQAADQDAGAALVATAQRRYDAATVAAKRAYDRLVAAAARLQISLEPQARPADDRAYGASPMFVDPIPPLSFGRPALAKTAPTRVAVAEIPVPAAPTAGWVQISP